MSNIRRAIRFNVVMDGIVTAEKACKEISKVETVVLTSISEAAVMNSDTEEMEHMLMSVEAIISTGKYGIPKDMEALDYIVNAVKYN